MPLLENGVVVTNNWRTVSEEEALGTGDILISFARLEDGLARPESDGRLGVVLTPDTEVAKLRHALTRLDLIAVTFPIFRDGRGFSQARALREYFGYKGEIRSIGKTLPDQYEFLLRCGFTSVEIPEGSDIAPWTRAHAAFNVAYQPSILNEAPQGFALRRMLAQ